MNVDKAIETLLAQITPGTTAGDALQITQAIHNLACAKATLENLKRDSSDG